MNRIFISYSKADIKIVKVIEQKLLEYSCNVWFDKKIPNGTRWDREIEKEVT